MGVDELKCLHHREIVTNTLEIRTKNGFETLSVTAVPIDADVRDVYLRARSSIFPLRFARDMWEGFERYDAICKLEGSAVNPRDAFRYAFPDSQYNADAFFQAREDWKDANAELRAVCKTDKWTDGFLWPRVQASANEARRLRSLRAGQVPKPVHVQHATPVKRESNQADNDRGKRPRVKVEDRDPPAGTAAQPISVEDDSDYEIIIEID